MKIMSPTSQVALSAPAALGQAAALPAPTTLLSTSVHDPLPCSCSSKTSSGKGLAQSELLPRLPWKDAQDLRIIRKTSIVSFMNMWLVNIQEWAQMWMTSSLTQRWEMNATRPSFLSTSVSSKALSRLLWLKSIWDINLCSFFSPSIFPMSFSLLK